MFKLIFVAPKFRLRRVKKKGQKREKNEKLRFAKKYLFILSCSRIGNNSGGSHGSKKSCGTVLVDKL